MSKYTEAIRYSYLIRTPTNVYHTLSSPNLPVVLTRIESQLVQLASTGELSLEEVGTRIEDARQYIEVIKERNKFIVASKIGKAVSKVGTGQSEEEDKAKRRAYLEKRRASKKALTTQSEQPSTPH